MALARMTLHHRFDQTIRQLVLLADIGETAVRTSQNWPKPGCAVIADTFPRRNHKKVRPYGT
jgi:hypothetical protein